MAAPPRKRPFYLVLALLGALLLGTSGASGGWAMVTLYRQAVDPSRAGAEISDEADRAALTARFEAYLQALDAARPRGWPIAVGTLVLGSGVLLFALRALGGSNAARSALVQLVVAQAALSVASYWLLGDVLEAELRWGEATQAARIHEDFPRHEHTDEALRLSSKLLRMQPRAELALGTLSSFLVVFGLTRRRAREFFDSASGALGGR